MANTYTLIASTTVGSGGASSIDFTSIPATYTDLLVKLSARRTQAYADVYLRFNGSSSTIYSYRSLRGDGSATASNNASSQNYGYIGAGANRSSWTASTFSNLELYIPNYAGSNNKSYSVDTVTENNATAADSTFVAGLWASTSAINQITLYPDIGYGDFVQYTTAYLYGIKSS